MIQIETILDIILCSHSHLKTKRTWKPNIQRVRAIVDGEVKRINVCTRCLRSGKVQRNA